MATSFIELASACTGKPSNAVKCHICREMGLPCPNQCCLFPMRFSPRSEVKDDDDDSITPDWVVDFEEEDSDSENEDDLDFGETKSNTPPQERRLNIPS